MNSVVREISRFRNFSTDPTLGERYVNVVTGKYLAFDATPRRYTDVCLFFGPVHTPIGFSQNIANRI